MDENQNIDKSIVGHIVTADEVVMDESTIIREQERLANEKKKKKSAKKKKIALCIMIPLLAAATWYLGWGYKLFNKNVETTVEIEKTDNQNIKFVKVNSINGNEVNVTVLKEVETRGDSDGQTPEDFGSESSRGQTPEGFGSESSSGQMPEGFGSESSSGQMPEGFSGGDFNGQVPNSAPQAEGTEGTEAPAESVTESTEKQSSNRPSRGNSDGQMPGGFGSEASSGDMSGFGSEASSGDMSGGFGGQAPGGNNTGRGQSASASNSKRSSSQALTYDNKTYALTDEKETTLIPVGTTVTTKLGTKTTFSRISSGDCLAFVTEVIDGEEVIISVYIVG